MDMIPISKLMGRLGNQMFQYAYLYSQCREGEIPDVYLQNEKYFEKYRHEVRALFSEGIGTLPYVAIHVRRGDYVGNPFYVDLCKDGYYERAMEEFPNAAFLVFSDDIPWCKQQDVFRKCDFSGNLSETEDLNMMASCMGHIIANSSFSWWGAWLSPHGGKVIAPARWFSDGVERVGLSSNWKRV
jgi:hypothetical protein